MKIILLIVIAIVVIILARRLMAGPSMSPAEADKLVASGAAVLVDVREPSECASGVAASALLLPLSDLRGDRRLWKPALEKHRDSQFILYCASGMRSATAAGILRREGFKAANVGGYHAWKAAGLPVRQP